MCLLGVGGTRVGAAESGGHMRGTRAGDDGSRGDTGGHAVCLLGVGETQAGAAESREHGGVVRTAPENVWGSPGGSPWGHWRESGRGGGWGRTRGYEGGWGGHRRGSGGDLGVQVSPRGQRGSGKAPTTYQGVHQGWGALGETPGGYWEGPGGHWRRIWESTAGHGWGGQGSTGGGTDTRRTTGTWGRPYPGGTHQIWGSPELWGGPGTGGLGQSWEWGDREWADGDLGGALGGVSTRSRLGRTGHHKWEGTGGCRKRVRGELGELGGHWRGGQALWQAELALGG